MESERMVIDKESVYDEGISPLVQQIIEACQRESIPFVMGFGLREGDENTEAVRMLESLGRTVPIGRVDAPLPRGSML